ncbi:MAG TPA: malectin domain-containing carbohydrate-binding protein [Candidatus Sulfotelmatobacter sp.]|nr:malectin domain-containing carbohydrate-binding protein [Candidatus Sulfotelmatobacter sp.]
MPSTTAEPRTWEAERAELQAVLHSPIFARSPALSHLLSYLCEKTFAGETDQIKEYSVALDVFDRSDAFDQDTDSIVRVQANRLRKRLSEYYAAEGAGHAIRLTIPVGQYVPSFQQVTAPDQGTAPVQATPQAQTRSGRYGEIWVVGGVVIAVGALVFALLLARPRPKPQVNVSSVAQQPAEPTVGLPVGDEVHILSGAARKYIDHAGKVWDPDAYFDGGNAVQSSVQHIWRTQDPIIYRSSRQGEFAYNIPLKPGTYELRLHFAENFYGPESAAGGGEGSRTMSVLANGQPLLHDFDVLADAGGERTAEVKVFPDISPASDGQLHLSFSPGKSGSAMLSAIQILPGMHGQLRPVRIVARDVPYYSNDSRWWSPDAYFKGGQLSSSQEASLGTDDPEFYETERWGHFSYAIPVAPGKYTVTLHFIEHNPAESRSRGGAPGPEIESADRVFNVFCNGKTILANLNIVDEVGENRPLVRKIKGLEPNAQGKLLLEFVPVTGYATVTAIEVVEE